MKVVFDLDDLCDDLDPWEELHELKEKYPGLRVTLFAIPGRSSNELLRRYRALDWVRLGTHGYHHSSYECAVWTKEEAQKKLNELERRGWPKLFKAPGWIANEAVYEALDELWWDVADNAEQEVNWRMSIAKRYVYNDKRLGEKAIHGHTWDTQGNGPSDWAKMFEDVPEDAEFLFVEDCLKTRSALEFLDIELKPSDLIIDIGGFIGEEVSYAVEHGLRIETYEPVEKFFQKIWQRYSGKAGVSINHGAVWDSDGHMDIYGPDKTRQFYFESSCSLIPGKDNIDFVLEKVPTIDAEKVVQGRDIALLKIDAEGAEFVILERILDTVGFDRIKQVYIEDHHNKITDDQWQEHRKHVLKRLKDVGVKLGEWV